jgi:O-antigen/teichoic acid export membrane protein
MSNFWQAILSSENTTSSKRVVTLITAACFFAAQFLIIFIAFYVIFYTTKGKVDKDLLGMLKDVLEYDFYIILSGLGFITAENFGQVMLQKAKAKIDGNVSVGSPTADTMTITKAETTNTDTTNYIPEPGDN